MAGQMTGQMSGQVSGQHSGHHSGERVEPEGAEGRRATAQALAEVPTSEWRVFHDVAWPGRRHAHLDHVVVGPSGVFVVDTLSWTGRVDVRGGALRQDGRRRSRPVVSAAAAAMAVSELVPELAVKAINPVLCFARDEPVYGWCGDVMVCSTENIVTFLLSRPRVLDDNEVHEVAMLLSLALGSAPTPVWAQPRPARTAPGAPGRSSGRPNRLRAALPRPWRAALVVGVLAVVAAAAFGLDLPQKLGHLGSTAAHQVTTPTTPIGEAVTLDGTGDRPSLQVRAGTPVVTHSTSATVHPAAGHVLVAVPLSVRNLGDSTWKADDGLKTEADDVEGGSYSSDPGYTSVAAGRSLPDTFELRAGRTTHGVVVFEVDRGTRISDVRLSVGWGPGKSAHWRVG